MTFILRMAGREIRASWQRLLFFFVCIAIGVGSIVALRSVIQSVRVALAGEARTLLGADLALSNAQMDFWTRFAATGNPNPPGQDTGYAHDVWLTYHGASAKYLTLEVPTVENRRPREAACDYWDGLFLRSLVGSVPASAPYQ